MVVGRLNEKLFVEFLEKEAKSFRVYDQYRANYNRSLLTRKFYTSDALDLDSADPEVIACIIKAKEFGPKEKHKWPITENQCYGWFSEVSVPKNPRFHYGRVFDRDMLLEAAIRTMEKNRPKFVGTPFKY